METVSQYHAAMRRKSFKHEYHDAILRRIRFDDDRITIEVDLCSHCNHGFSPRAACLIFESVKNMDEIRQTLSCQETEMIFDGKTDIVGIDKIGKTRYLLDLRPGPLEIDCRGLLEI